MNLPTSAACQAGSTPDDLERFEFLEDFRVDVHLIDEDAAGLLTHAPQHGIAHGARLLKNFFEHEMLVAAFFRHDGIPQNMGNLALDGASVEIGQMHAVGRQDGDVAIAQEEHVAGVAQDGGHVGRDEIFSVAQPDHHRRAHARRDDLVGIRTRDHAQGEDAVQVFHGAPHRVLQIPFVILFHQVRDDFGVGLGNELVAFQLELVLEAQIVFDDAVVHHHDIAGTVAMRVRVFFGGTPVRRPAGVADAVGAVHRVDANRVFQVAQFSRRSSNRQMVIAIQDCDTGRVITAVFEPAQPIQDDGDCSSVADIADNSTHTN